jgi:hypothetical protein
MPITLAEDEREVLMAEVAQALDQIRVPELTVTYGELLTAVDQGEVPDELLEPLQTLLEVGLESGRIRRVHTAHGEMAAGRVFSRTPRSRAVRSTTDELNASLKALEGQTIQELTLSPHGPGAYSLSIATDQGKLLLRMDRQGVRLQSLEVGG